MAQAKVGYAAMLEQFGPREVVDYCAAAEAAGLLRRHGGRPLPAVGAAAGPGAVRLDRHGRDRRADDRRLRAGRDLPGFRMHPAIVAQASATLEAIVPGPALAGPGLRRGAQRAHRGRLLARDAGADRADVRVDRDHPQALLRQGREARRPLVQARDDPPLDAARTRRRRSTSPPRARTPRRRPASSATGSSRSARREEKIETRLREVRGGRPVGRQGPVDDAEDPPAAPRPGRPRTRRRSANAMVEWPNGGMKFPKQDIRSPFDFAAMAKLVRPEDFEGRLVISEDPEVHRARHPEVPRPRLRPGLPAQRRAATSPRGSRSSAATCCRSSTGDRRATDRPRDRAGRRMKVVALAGGVGGARLAHGLAADRSRPGTSPSS